MGMGRGKADAGREFAPLPGCAGAYLEVVAEGVIRVGDVVTVGS
jgi:MOSC domain-containing protein YiiM